MGQLERNRGGGPQGKTAGLRQSTGKGAEWCACVYPGGKCAWDVHGARVCRGLGDAGIRGLRVGIQAPVQGCVGGMVCESMWCVCRVLAHVDTGHVMWPGWFCAECMLGVHEPRMGSGSGVALGEDSGLRTCVPVSVVNSCLSVRICGMGIIKPWEAVGTEEAVQVVCVQRLSWPGHRGAGQRSLQSLEPCFGSAGDLRPSLAAQLGVCSWDR